MTGYKDCNWTYLNAANGQSGEGLANTVVGTIKRLDNVSSICDLGCGNGYLAGQLSQLGYRVTGIDASRSGIELASTQYSDVEFLCSLVNLEAIDSIQSRDFDLVVSSDVIEHLYRPADLLETANELLKPQGHLLLGTPYHGYLKNLVLSFTGRMDGHFTALWDGGHIKFFSVNTLSQIIRQHGFTDLSFHFYGRAPYLWKNMICHAVKSKEPRDA